MPADSSTLKALAWAAALTVACVSCRPAAANPPALGRLADIVIPRDSEIFEAFVPHRTTFAELLQAHDLLSHEAAALLAGIAEKFDLRQLRAGQAYRLDQFRDGRVREFEYEIDRDRRLLVRRLDEPNPSIDLGSVSICSNSQPFFRDSTNRRADGSRTKVNCGSNSRGFEVELAPIEKVIDRLTVVGEISQEMPSLTQALEATGERIELSLALADVFSGEIDFTNDLQPGDTFRLVVERASRVDGSFVTYGPVLAAEFINAGRRLRAVRFTPAEGKAGYYDAEGRSIRRFFLKSPLRFEPRITSRFSRARRHPILDYTRAHNGVDYAATTGAPVGAVASGVVTLAGWTSGGGHTVRIRHASGYESEYLHLSAIARGIRRGTRVAQGELVGRVGATGLATGPHLHYGLRRNGAYVNPLNEHKNMPPGEPIAVAYRVRFDAERDRLFGLLSGSTPRTTN